MTMADYPESTIPTVQIMEAQSRAQAASGAKATITPWTYTTYAEANNMKVHSGNSQRPKE